MFSRMIAQADAPALVDGVRNEPSGLSATHLRWLQSLLSDSPASLQNVPLGKVSDLELVMEWQAVFQGAGVAYYRAGGAVVAVGLMLDGRFPSSEQAAIDAVQQTVQSARSRGNGFELIRKQTQRPLRALVLTDSLARGEMLAVLEYWADCLTAAYFGKVGELLSGDDQAISLHGGAASAM